MSAESIRASRPRLIALLAALVACVLCAAVPAQAEEAVADPTPIYDAAGLAAIADDPFGSYRLMCDVDLAGVAWQPLEFFGTFDGGGHAILNASVTDLAATYHDSYDGNLVRYDTRFAGLFGSLEGATVRDLALLGVHVDVTSDEPTFAGALVGYMADAVVENCVVAGDVWLQTSGASFGVGGVAGFGTGRVAACTVDVTLVCRDTDAYTKDEQFMGGVYADGYADIVSCDVTIRGFDSDHGYVHDGGLAGMYIIYPEDTGDHWGEVSGNSVRGHITFFEDNEDRRAYCDPEIGELMNPWSVEVQGNATDEFVRDERFVYDVDLLPHECGNPQWVEEVVAPTCDERGYTVRTCTTCGYAEQVSWTPVVHEVGEWSVVEASVGEDSAVRSGTCARCGTEVFEVTSAELASAEGTETGQDGAEATASERAGLPMLPLIAGVVALVVVAVAVVVLIVRRRRAW